MGMHVLAWETMLHVSLGRKQIRDPFRPIRPQHSECAAEEECTTTTDSPLSTPAEGVDCFFTAPDADRKVTPPREADGRGSGGEVSTDQLRQAVDGEGGRREPDGVGVVYGCMERKKIDKRTCRGRSKPRSSPIPKF